MGESGNVDGDPGELIDIGDLTALISYLYIPPNPSLPCPNEANVDGDLAGLIDIGDLTALISYLYIPPNPLPALCPEPIGSVTGIPQGSSIVVDGVIDTGEWSDAVSQQFGVDDHVDVTLLVKHDGSSLLLAYHFVFVHDDNLCFPEVMIDVGNDKAENWSSNDWWFHVSGTDCEGNGEYDVYDDCAVVQPDWQAAPNYAMVPDPPAVDTFEIRIPFSKIGVSIGDTLGIAYRAEWVPYTFGYWPSGAAVEFPSSWGTAILRQ
jgi:hypothetical protein